MTARPCSFPAILSVLALAACGGRDAATPESAQAGVAVRTAVVAMEPFTETIGAIGAVAPRPGHVAALSAPSPTRVARVLVTTGQRVSKGDTLVELDQTTFEAAAGSAEAALAAAERAYERASRLAEAGIIPRKELEQAAADLARARAETVSARRAKDLSVLRAPIGGVITRMAAVLGAEADPGQPLVEIADPAALDILLNVSPSDAGRIRPGTNVVLSAGQSAAGEPLGTGRVRDIAGTVDSISRAVLVRIQVPASGRPLRIGETVYGRIVLDTRAAALTVPLDALVPSGEGFKVFVVDSGGVARGRPVVVGGRTATVAEITGGLAAGERVVTYGAYGLEDGSRIVELKR